MVCPSACQYVLSAMCQMPGTNADLLPVSGVIALTSVGSRQAGWACAFWLMLLGIFGKFGGWVRSIPNCVLGGMTTFLFANVIASGIKVSACGDCRVYSLCMLDHTLMRLTHPRHTLFHLDPDVRWSPETP